ncbi:MAG: 16S rRNA (uracil(1498)-N(3))-methyltransferase, partial [Coxiellaceae bacterium]|nr:16S rRNA (uracil(1498)-N(3))-methyltransferase [Coxiellaceae bacterium]
MQITRIYTQENLAVGEKVHLEKQASQHLLRVLRASINDPVVLFNGRGGEFHGALFDAKKDQAIIELHRFEDVNRESPLSIHLLQGISRGERMDYVIQKATELGVSKITPLFTERTTVRLDGARLEKRVAHWQQVSISACEQSGRCQVPKINLPITLNEYLKKHQGPGIFCDTSSQTLFNRDALKEKAVTMLIGPEGGLSKNEIKSVEEKN